MFVQYQTHEQSKQALVTIYQERLLKKKETCSQLSEILTCVAGFWFPLTSKRKRDVHTGSEQQLVADSYRKSIVTGALEKQRLAQKVTFLQEHYLQHHVNNGTVRSMEEHISDDRT